MKAIIGVYQVLVTADIAAAQAHVDYVLRVANGVIICMAEQERLRREADQERHLRKEARWMWAEQEWVHVRLKDNHIMDYIRCRWKLSGRRVT